MYDSPIERAFFGEPQKVKVIDDPEITHLNIELPRDDSDWQEWGKMDSKLFWAGYICSSTEDLIDEIENCEPITEEMIISSEQCL